MRISSGKSFLFCLISALGVLPVAFFAIAQEPAKTPSIKTKRLSDYVGKVAGAQGSKVRIRLSADNLNPVAGQNVHFTVTGTEGFKGLQYDFDWGDSQKTSAQQPVGDHVYAQPGSYSAQVTVREAVAIARIAIPSNQLAITVAQPLVPVTLELQANPLKAAPGDLVRFTATLTPPDESVRYHFIFGDETEENSPSSEITHAYKDAGDYQPVVTASVPGREETYSSKALLVEIRPVAVTEVKLKADLLTVRPTLGQEVAVSAWLEPPSKSTTFHFNWGDGLDSDVVGTRVQATHLYQESRKYEVTVSVSRKGVDPAIVLVGVAAPRPSESPWPAWLLGLLVAAAAVAATLGVSRLRRPPPPSPPGLHFRPGADPDEHRMSNLPPSGPHISVTLKTGTDPGSDRIIFPKADTSDQEEHHAG